MTLGDERPDRVAPDASGFGVGHGGIDDAPIPSGFRPASPGRPTGGAASDRRLIPPTGPAGASTAGSVTPTWAWPAAGRAGVSGGDERWGPFVSRGRPSGISGGCRGSARCRAPASWGARADRQRPAGLRPTAPCGGGIRRARWAGIRCTGSARSPRRGVRRRRSLARLPAVRHDRTAPIGGDPTDPQASVRPPTRPTSGWRTSTMPRSARSRNSNRVFCHSPAAIGIGEWSWRKA